MEAGCGKSGEFYITYGKDRHGNPLFRNFCELDANAAHIVKCVNAHEELLEACRFALKDAEGRLYMLPIDGKGVSEQKDILSCQIGRYRAAIAKAEGKVS